MKHKITLLTLSLFLSTTFSFAQKTIKASDIMQDVKNGKSISYKNTTIVGVLDFTYMDDALDKLPERKKKSGWFNLSSNNYSTNQVKKMIDVNISFVNCIFKGDVLAYIPHEDSGYTFTASFKGDVIFTNCNFERKAMFKYSRFENEADFSESMFDDDTSFKYAKFDDKSSFSNTTFDEIATFKYAKFSNYISFSNALFKDAATFKYTKFHDGVSFKNTKFEEDLNIKYMQVSGDFIITNMNVAYDIDSKYTKINGKSFSKYLIDEK